MIMFFEGLFDRKVSLEKSGVLQGMQDSHTHLLYGVDDGIATLEDSLAVLDFLYTLGVKEVWCTPHIMEDVPNTTQFLKQRFDELHSSYDGDVIIHLAAEYMLDNLFQERLQSGDLLLNGDMLLVEASAITPPYNMTGMLQDILKAGYRPVLAHPERYRYMDEKQYETLHNMGVYFQMNLPSIIGFYGDTACSKTRWLLEKGMYQKVGSDCHRYNLLRQQYSAPKASSKALKLLEKLIQSEN